MRRYESKVVALTRVLAKMSQASLTHSASVVLVGVSYERCPRLLPVPDDGKTTVGSSRITPSEWKPAMRGSELGTA